MASKFLVIRQDLRELERRLRVLHAKLGDHADWQPLEGIANAIGTFAEMLPVYKSFVDFVEAAHGIDAPANPELPR